MDTAAAPPASRLRAHAPLVLLALLVALHLARVPYAATHLDFARDVFVAWRFLHGEEVPLAGPVLAGTIHLGPAWYWLLAALLAFARSWFGVVLALGVLSATQVLLAWRLGRLLHGERAGLLWASLLALPSWSGFEWMLPQHYVLTAPLVLAFLLCAVHYVRERRARWLIGMALSFVFALHAHPSSIGLAWIGLGVFVHAAWTRQCHWRAWLAAVLAALVPLLPYLWWSAGNGFADFRAGGAYLLDGQSTGHAAAALPLLYEATLGGLQYWLDVLLAWPGTAVASVLALVAAIVAAALYGYAALLRDASTRRLAFAALASVAALALTTALIRHQTTYYMITSLRVVACGALAIGLAALGRAAVARGVQGAAIMLALGLNLVCGVVAARFLVVGNWPFDFAALFDVTARDTAPQPLPLLPAYAMRDSAALLCAETATTVHGAYARHLLYDYAIEMRLRCGRSDTLAGGDAPSRMHWLGLARSVAKTTGLAQVRRIGPLALYPVRRVVAGDAFAAPDVPRYPVHVPKTNALQTRVYAIRLAPDERLAVSDVAFFVAPPQVDASAALRLVAADAVTRVYACDDCAAGIDLRVTTQNFSDTDIVVFAATQ